VVVWGTAHQIVCRENKQISVIIEEALLMRLKLIFAVFCLMLFPLLCSANTVSLSIPEELLVSQGQQNIKVPIYISDVTDIVDANDFNISSAEIKVSYDSGVIEATGVDLIGTIAEGSELNDNIGDGNIIFAFASDNALEEGGTFAFVLFDAVTNEAQASSTLTLEFVKLNEGQGLTIEIDTDFYTQVDTNDTQIQTPPRGANTATFTDLNLKMDFTSNSAADPIRVTIIENRPAGTLPGGMSSLLNKYWVIERLGSGTFNTSFTFTLGSGMLSPNDEANPDNLKLFRRDTNSTGSWAPVTTATSANAATGEVKFEGIESFSQFIIGTTGDSPLPVRLSGFTALPLDDSILLKWTTQTEIDNVGFFIYRSETEYGDYAQIGFIQGAGNSAISYTFTDKDVEPGKTYFYYLQDIDITGEKSQSNIIKIVVPKLKLATLGIIKEFRLLQNFPNPFNPETWIPYELAQEADVRIDIYNTSGQLVRTLELGRQSRGRYVRKDTAAHWDGRNRLGEHAANGLYFYVLKAGNFTAARKMVIVK